MGMMRSIIKLIFILKLTFFGVVTANSNLKLEKCLGQGDIGNITLIEGKKKCVPEFKSKNGFSYALYSPTETCATKDPNKLICNQMMFGPSLCIKKDTKNDTTIACTEEFKRQWNKKQKNKKQTYKHRANLASNIEMILGEVRQTIKRLKNSGVCETSHKACLKLYTHMTFLNQVSKDLALPYAHNIKYPIIKDIDSRRPKVIIHNHNFGSYGHGMFQKYTERFDRENKFGRIKLAKIMTEKEYQQNQSKPLPFKEQAQICMEIIRDYFKDDKSLSDDEITKYIKAQADLTLHRVAWANLNLMKNDGNITNADKKKFDLEKNLKRLLKHKLSFHNASKKFDTLTEKDMKKRSFLFETLADFKDIINNQSRTDNPEDAAKDIAFKLNSSDIKMLSILKENEVSEKSNSKTMLNFTTLINSSYTSGNNNRIRSAALRSRNQNKIERHIKRIERKLDKDLSSLVIDKCLNKTSCSPTDKKRMVAQMFPNLLDVFKSITSGLKMRSDTDLHKDLKFGTLWTKTTKD